MENHGNVNGSLSLIIIIVVVVVNPAFFSMTTLSPLSFHRYLHVYVYIRRLASFSTYFMFMSYWLTAKIKYLHWHCDCNDGNDDDDDDDGVAFM